MPRSERIKILCTKFSALNRGAIERKAWNDLSNVQFTMIWPPSDSLFLLCLGRLIIALRLLVFLDFGRLLVCALVFVGLLVLFGAGDVLEVLGLRVLVCSVDNLALVVDRLALLGELLKGLLASLVKASRLLFELLHGALRRRHAALLDLRDLLAFLLAHLLLVHDALRTALKAVIPDLNAILAIEELAFALALHARQRRDLERAVDRPAVLARLLLRLVLVDRVAQHLLPQVTVGALVLGRDLNVINRTEVLGQLLGILF